MAIVKGPALSVEASGNLGAICYSRWGNLQIAKDVWTGTVPNTAKQVVIQGYMTSVSQAWGGTLSTADRQTWTDLARSIVWRSRLGDTYVPRGYQLFMKWNIRRKVMGLAIMLTAPVVQERVFVLDLNHGVYLTGPFIAVNLRKEVGVGVDGYGVEYYRAGPYESGGRSPIEGEWLFIDREVPPGVYKDYDVIVNKWYWYRGRQIAKFGDVGNWFQIQVQFA